jgi:hypothetical protein
LFEEWWPWADVVHLNSSAAYLDKYKSRVVPRPLVVQYHGTKFRRVFKPHLRTAKIWNALQIASTIDLCAVAPQLVTWAPAPYEREELAQYASPEDDGVMKIAHAPTDRKTKGTEFLIHAVKKMKREGKRVSLDIIERVDNEACMRRKGRADVYVDQLYLGYGCNAIEAWGMGIPVIAGLDPVARRRIGQEAPRNTRKLMISTWDKLPFRDVTERTLYEALNDMLDSDERAFWALRGRTHFERFHEGSAVVARVRPIYQAALDRART